MLAPPILSPCRCLRFHAISHLRQSPESPHAYHDSSLPAVSSNPGGGLSFLLGPHHLPLHFLSLSYRGFEVSISFDRWCLIHGAGSKLQDYRIICGNSKSCSDQDRIALKRSLPHRVDGSLMHRGPCYTPVCTLRCFSDRWLFLAELM